MPPIVKRTFIDNTIIKDLNEKYPPSAEKNGVAYKQKLDYLTFETDFLSDSNFRELRDKHGNDVIAVIFYLRTEMCKNGWFVKENDKYLINDCSYHCKIAQDKVETLLEDLICKKIIFRVCDDSFEEGTLLTCPQQIYNFEMASSNRQKSRERNSKKRKQQTGQKHFYTDSSSFSSQQPPDTFFDDDPFGLFKQKAQEQ